MELYYYKATCLRVVDGDTLDLSIDLGLSTFKKERVRLLNIDTSEIYGVKKDSEEYQKGMLSKVRVEELVLGNDLTIKTSKDKKRKYGRYLCEVYIEDQKLGEMLVKEGHAEYREY